MAKEQGKAAIAKPIFEGMVRALRQGYDNVCLREPGDVFKFKGVLSSWIEPVQESKLPAASSKEAVKAKGAAQAAVAPSDGRDAI